MKDQKGKLLIQMIFNAKVQKFSVNLVTVPTEDNLFC